LTAKEEFEYTKCAEACKGIFTLNLAKSDFILFDIRHPSVFI